MRSINLSLSKKSIQQLRKQVVNAAQKISEAPDKIIEKLLNVGEAEAEANILRGYDADGNTDIYVDSSSVIGGGKLSMNGFDVAYQEFGYGLVGNIDRNPKQPPYYKQGQRTDWVYVDDNGNVRFSHGMQAQMPMYKASIAMRDALPDIVSELKEDIKIG